MTSASLTPPQLQPQAATLATLGYGGQPPNTRRLPPAEDIRSLQYQCLLCLCRICPPDTATSAGAGARCNSTYGTASFGTSFTLQLDASRSANPPSISPDLEVHRERCQGRCQTTKSLGATPSALAASAHRSTCAAACSSPIADLLALIYSTAAPARRMSSAFACLHLFSQLTRLLDALHSTSSLPAKKHSTPRWQPLLKTRLL